MALRPVGIIAIYIIVILGFAVAYYFAGVVPGSSIARCVYFSTVTITTLGYGDIVPSTGLGMALVSVEAIGGIILIGLFLNSSWHSYVDRIQKISRKEMENQERNRQVRRLHSYFRYLRVVVDEFRLAVFEATTPLPDREKVDLDRRVQFKDLQHIYSISIRLNQDFKKPVIERFFEKQDVLIEEFRYFLSNFDLFEYEEIQSSVIEFLSASRRFDARESLLSYPTTQVGDKTMGVHLTDLIKEHETCPDPNNLRGNILLSAILLYRMIEIQQAVLRSLSLKFSEITVSAPDQ